MLNVCGVWEEEDRAPGGNIGHAFGRCAVVDDRLFLGPSTLGKRFFRGRIRVWIGWEEVLKCRLKLSKKAPICGG